MGIFLAILPTTAFADEATDRKLPAYKKQIAEKVFQSLKQAAGLSPSDPPTFELTTKLKGNYASAMINYREQKIYLEEEAYDICTQHFGRDSLDALATYLAHELAHFRSNHAVKNHYTRAFKDDIYETNLPQLSSKLSQREKNELILLLFNSLTASTEAEADLQGGFLAYLAGYKTIGLGQQLLDETYKYFKIDPAPPNQAYPSLQERKDIVLSTEKELKRLINLYELANLLTAVGRYEASLHCYQLILRQFQSREIYNNIGVGYLLSFLDKADPKKVRFAFPVELDLQTRLRATKSGSRDHLVQLLDAAVEHFQQAIARDKSYDIGHLNLANAYCLQAVYTSEVLPKAQFLALAKAYALRAKVLGSQQDTAKKLLADAEILLGIIQAVEGEAPASVKVQMALALTHMPQYQLYKDNLAFLAGEAPQRKTIQLSETTIDLERIENKSIARIKANLIFQDSTLDRQKVVRVYTNAQDPSSLRHSKLLTYRGTISKENKTLEEIFSFHLTKSDQDNPIATDAGIGHGDSRQKIVAATAYGPPDREVQLGRGTFLIYDAAQKIFELDEQQRVKRWGIFQLTQR